MDRISFPRETDFGDFLLINVWRSQDAEYARLCEFIITFWRNFRIYLCETEKEASENNFVTEYMLNKRRIHVSANSSEKFVKYLLNQSFYAVQQCRFMWQLSSGSLNDFQYQVDTKALESYAKRSPHTSSNWKWYEIEIEWFSARRLLLAITCVFAKVITKIFPKSANHENEILSLSWCIFNSFNRILVI